jgi:hypothetical protein
VPVSIRRLKIGSMVSIIDRHAGPLCRPGFKAILKGFKVI